MRWLLTADLHLSDRPRDAMKFRRAYSQQKSNAKRRGVPFKLSFEEWLSIWIESGKLSQRGKLKGQYCMARHQDQGTYEIGNVSVVQSSVNCKDAPKQRDSEAHRAALRSYYAANPMSKGQKKNISKALQGRIMPPATRLKMSSSARRRGPNNTKINADLAHRIFIAPGTHKEIAKRFGISKSQVGNIKLRKSWAATTAGLSLCAG